MESLAARPWVPARGERRCVGSRRTARLAFCAWRHAAAAVLTLSSYAAVAAVLPYHGVLVEHRIELPTGLRVHSAKYFFENVEFFPKTTPERIVLSFHPRFTHFEPFAVSMLAAWGQFWKSRGVPIRCENVTKKGVPYAQRMGLFKYIPCDDLIELEEHEEAGKFIPLQHITRRSEMSKLMSEIGGILRDPELIRLGQHALSEMSRNVVEHADAEGFFCAQYYPTTKHVSIGVADCGRGVREALEEAYGFRTHEEALLAALRPGVSGRSRAPYSASDNAGLGLFVARGLAKAGRQYFMLASGDCAFRMDKLPSRTTSLHPHRDPASEKHKLFTGLKRWKGTVVAIDLRGMDRSFEIVMHEIGQAISDDHRSAHTKSRLRFV